MVKEKSSCLPQKVMNACHGECVITWVPTYIHHFSSVHAIRGVFLGNYRGNRPNKLMEQERLCLMHLVQGSHLIGRRL